MNHWWRAYNEAVNDPKLQLLSDALFRAWFNVMCIASSNDGNLPPLKDIAFTLRIQPTKAAQVLAQLHTAGLLDKTETGFIPHNWNGRQYKSDKTDETAAERMARYRERKRNERNSAVTVTATREQTTEQIDVAVDARAKPPSQSFELAEKLLVIAGHDPKFWPPGWCGAPMRVETWLSQGWKPEIIIAAVTAAASRKRGLPANSVNFFENAIAEEVARQAAPLPNVEIKQAETLTVTHGKSKNGITQAADDLCRQLADFDGPPRRDHELRSPEGEASPRLLSHG